MFYLGACGDQCCIVEKKEILDSTGQKISESMRMSSTNWGGRDSIERVLRYKGWEIAGEPIKLSAPMVNSGEDCDHGKRYSYSFEFHTLIPVRPTTESIPIKVGYRLNVQSNTWNHVVVESTALRSDLTGSGASDILKEKTLESAVDELENRINGEGLRNWIRRQLTISSSPNLWGK